MVLPVALALLQTQETRIVFRAPAGQEYAVVQPGGRTILPNGRFLTPKGKRLYGMNNMWNILLHPNQKQLFLFHDGGYTTYENWADALPKKGMIARKDPAYCAAVLKDGKRMVISLGEEGAVQIVDTTTGAEIATLNANVDGAKLSYINDFALSPGEKYLYCADVANQDLLTFDLETKTLVSRVKAGRQPYAIALSEDGQRIFIANIGVFDYSMIPGRTPDSPGLEVPAFAFPSKESEEGVESEGRQIPGLGKPDVPSAHSVYSYSLRNPAKPEKVADVKTGVLIHSLADGGKAVGGSAPCALHVRGTNLYVSNSNNDTVQIFDTQTLKLVRNIKIAPVKELAKFRGIIPSALTTNQRGDRLFVCESGINAVAVIDPRSGRFLYHIPTGWWPTGLQLSADEKTLFISTQKGLGRGPQGPKHPRPNTDERFGLPPMPGMVDIVTLPTDTRTQNAWTQEALVNNGMVNQYAALAKTASQNPIPLIPGKESNEIKYVVFITKENHTFDGIFGGLKGSKSEPDYAEYGRNGWIREKGREERVPIMPNHINLAERWAISDNFYMEPQASGDGHRWLVGVYPSYWTTRVFYSGWNFAADDSVKGRLSSFGSNGSQIPEDYLENGSMWEHFDRAGITFRNYGEGYEFAAQIEAANPPRSGSYLVVNHPLNKVLWANTDWGYPMYNTNIPDIARVEWFKEDLEKNFRQKGKPIPRFMNLTLCNDHGDRARPNDGYPYTASFMADNDLALGRLVEYLSQQPEWKNMAIFVTQDDPGGDNDSVDRHRSFVLAISPYAKKGYVSKDHTSIMSILKTIYLIFGMGPNHQFDALATDLRDMFTMTPDFAPYKHENSDPRVFVDSAAYNPNDPSWASKKRYMQPGVRMDDPNFIDWLRSQPEGTEKKKP